MSTRQAQQFSGLIQRGVQSVLDAGLADPRLDAFITVTKVSVDTPPRVAFVSVSVMPEKHESRVLHGLKDAARHIRREAGEILDLHRMPELHFRIDRSLKRQTEVLDALARVRREEEARGEGTGGGGWSRPVVAENETTENENTAGDEPVSRERESSGE